MSIFERKLMITVNQQNTITREHTSYPVARFYDSNTLFQFLRDMKKGFMFYDVITGIRSTIEVTEVDSMDKYKQSISLTFTALHNIDNFRLFSKFDLTIIDE